MRGDVDGDRRADDVELVTRPRAPSRCSVFLVVRPGHGRTVARRVRVRPGDPPPVLNGLVRIGPGPLEIVVTVEQGASTAFASVFGLRDGRLVALTRSERPDLPFAYEGSTTHLDAIDCRKRSGLIVATSWEAPGIMGPGMPSMLIRKIYRLGGQGFEIVAQDYLGRVGSPFRYREFQGRQPFPHCLTVRPG